MMDPKMAIHVLQCGGWWDSLPDDISDADMDPLQDALDAAIDALEKERRKYTCPMCNHEWWEDRDATDYPNYCPGCGEELRKEG